MALANKRSLDDFLWTALGYTIGAVQEACVPGIMHDLDIDTVLESREPKPAHKKGPEPKLAPVTFLQTVQEIAQAWDNDSPLAYGRYDSPKHHHHHREWND